MSDRDNITLPRELAEEALEALMVATTPIPADRHKVIGSITALRTHLAAEQPKPEPVAYFDGVLMFNEAAAISSAIDARKKEPSEDVEALRRDAERLTDEQIDSATSKERDELLDHIYEYGTAAEGILERIRKLARAAIDAAMEGKR